MNCVCLERAGPQAQHEFHSEAIIVKAVTRRPGPEQPSSGLGLGPGKFDREGFALAEIEDGREVSSARRLLFCAGQIALDPEGKVTCVGNMRGQIEIAMNNVETVLAAGGLSLANVVRLNFYTTDVDDLVAHYDVIKLRLAAVGCQPSSTLLGVKRLALPELLIEIEATAAE